MNFDKESESRKKKYFGEGVGVSTQELPYFIHKTHCHDSSTKLYSLMKIFLMVFKIDGIVALTIKER